MLSRIERDRWVKSKGLERETDNRNPREARVASSALECRLWTDT